MTQLTVSVEDVSMLDQIRQAISMLRGVSSVSLKRQTKTGMDRAIDDIKNGRVYEADSVEDLIKQCKAWECHITPDWLLVWDQNDRELVLLMTNTGTHSDLFGKNRR